jgi:hypothetical protein
MLKSRTTTNAATRIRASCSGWRRVAAWERLALGDVASESLALGDVAWGGLVVDGVAWGGLAVDGVDSWRREDGTVTGMIPIRYVTDRFGYLHDRTG